MTSNITPDNDALLAIYRTAALLKANDERSRKVIMTGRLVMPYYSYRGQEIIPAALCAHLTDDDYLVTIYRGIHDMLAKGMPLKQLWAEIAGRIDGTCKGKGGPMHLTHPAKGIMVTTGVVGSSMPIATGIAWGSQMSGNQRVTIAMFGDAASNIGAFHESLNLAAVWKLPVIFVCQNNLYGEHTTYEKATSAKRIADRGVAYDMPAVRVNGNDPDAMYTAAREAVERARSGGGPTLIEAMTFRFHGHVFGDADAYMENVASEAELAAIEAQIERDIDEAVEFALASPFPDLSELTRDVYAEGALA